MRKTNAIVLTLVLPVALFLSTEAIGQKTKNAPEGEMYSSGQVSSTGTVTLPAMEVPLSELISPQARIEEAKYFRFLNSSYAPGEKLAARDAYYLAALARARELYPVKLEARTIGGVPTTVFSPLGAAPNGKAERALIELHGGGFVGGWGLFSDLESIPVASVGHYTVVAVNYREGEKARFPEASEDVAAVYAELLKSYRPKNIGIYGCSAGGLLVAESVAWFQKVGLPRPGAIAILCASAGGYSGGDADYLSAPLIGLRTADPTQAKKAGAFGTATAPYFKNASFEDPYVAPVKSERVLGAFPATLVLTSTRAAEFSAAVHTHSELVRLGVDAELHVWEGLPHGFFTIQPGLPETNEAWNVVMRFFDRHLGSGE